MKSQEEILKIDRTKGDFTVRGRTVAPLSENEAAEVELYSEERYYAFEWLLSDDPCTARSAPRERSGTRKLTKQ